MRFVESGETLEVVKCFDVKNHVGNIQHKRAAIKSSPKIRSYIMNRNGDYIFCGFVQV